MDRETGLQLDQPRLLLQEDSAIGKGIFYGLLMLLGALGSWGCFLTAFDIHVHTGRVAFGGVICCAFAVWRQVDGRKRRWKLSMLGWLIWLAALIFAFDSIAHGAVRTVNTVLDSYGTKLNYGLPALYLPYHAGTRHTDAAGECTAFVMALLFPFFWAMARMWVRSRNNRGPFGLTGILLLLPMSFSILPAGWAFGALLLFWCMLLLLAPTLGGPEGSFGRRGKKGYRASGVGAARPLALLLALGAGLCMLAVYLYDPPEAYKRPQLAENLRTGLREGFGSSQYMRGGQGNTNKEVQLRKLGSRAYTGETVLRVRFDWQEDDEDLGDRRIRQPDGSFETESEWISDFSNPENCDKEYLKCFVGTEYTGASWERLGAEGREALEKLRLRAQNQTARYKNEMYVPTRDRHGWYRLSVQNLGANPRCVYVPSSLRSGPEELGLFDIELADDGFAKSTNFISGTMEYQLEGEARSFGSNYFSRVLGNLAYNYQGITNLDDLGSAKVGDIMEDRYFADVYPDGYRVMYFDAYPDYTSLAGVLMDLFDSINSQGNIGGPDWPADLWEMPRHYEAWDFFTTEQQELVDAVEEYNKFVYENYLDVPEELEGFLEDFRKAYDLDPLGHIDKGDFRYMDGVEYYAGRIAAVFQNYFKYSLDPPGLPEGRDFVEYFLSESHEGYCVHFASAAVMLLREAGYPARYAEGYVVPSSGEGWVDVPDYNAHAWVEVYCGGTGWLPVEVTPAAMDNPAAFYNATVPDNAVELIPTPQPETERPTLPPRRNELIENEPASPAPRASASAAPSPGVSAGPGGSGGGESPLIGVLLWLGGIIAAGGAVVLQRAVRIKKRERDLGQRDRNGAGLKAYAYLMRLYEKEVLCGERGEPPERWKELAEKARFSAHELSAEELSELTGDAQRLREKLKRQLPKGQKALCWLIGLI